MMIEEKEEECMEVNEEDQSKEIVINNTLDT